jgi:putative ABC transport system ATP-binding protein
MMNRGSAVRGPAAEALRLVSVSKVYGAGASAVTALDAVSLSLGSGTFTAVMGPSGSGKSTLLHCASGLDRPTGGEVFIGGTRMAFGGETEMTKFRRGRIGFIFQQFNLMPALTVRQNVHLPARLAGTPVDKRRVAAVLDRVGLGHRLDHRPAELSGGEQQRVAIARALVTNPNLVLADEPTGALDTATAREILTLLGEAVREFGQTVVMVTHDPVAASHAGSVLFLADGRLVGEMANPTASAVAERLTRLGDEVRQRRARVGAEA